MKWTRPRLGASRLPPKAYVTADAFGKQKFYGTVVRVGQHRAARTSKLDKPTEKVDNKVLETLVELDQGANLPVGLRVDAYILTGAEPARLR